DNYSYYFDNTIFPLLADEERRESKKSIIFLLERDVWATDEVYGRYLIDIKENHTEIGYYRFEKVFRNFSIKSTDISDIKDWICKDAVKQVQEQFEYLWAKLKKEINVCIKEKYRKKPKLELDSPYLKDQFEKTKNLVEKWPEAALLSLGRIMEIWLLTNLKEENVNCRDLIRMAVIRNIIDNHGKRLLNSIRKNYNDLKHNLFYHIDKNKIRRFVNQFNKIFTKS
ncbi:MAG: hypothetical protein P8Y97_20125, partial [Candidatus Lokiarchaeota archaeon]